MASAIRIVVAPYLRQSDDQEQRRCRDETDKERDHVPTHKLPSILKVAFWCIGRLVPLSSLAIECSLSPHQRPVQSHLPATIGPEHLFRSGWAAQAAVDEPILTEETGRAADHATRMRA